MKSCLAIAAILLVSAPAAAATTASAKDYNVFVFGDYTASSSDVQGRLAAGGNVKLSNYSIGSSLTAAANSSVNLLVGKKLTWNGGSGQLFHGSALAGSLDSSNKFTVVAGTVSTGAPTPANFFTAEQTRLTSLSTTLAAMVQTSGVTNKFQYGGFTLSTTNSGLSVFNISGANASSANNFTLTAAANAFVLINVDGTADSFQNMGFSLNGIDASHVLFNFSSATSLTFGGVGFLGSVLAPKANVTFNNGNFTGTLIAQSLFGGGEFHLAQYQGTLLDPPKIVPPAAVPEPSTWATMVAGFGLLGGALRRSRRKKAALA